MDVVGTAYVQFAFDAGFSIDLKAAAARLRQGGARRQFRHVRRAPSPSGALPLIFTRSAAPVAVGGVTTAETLEVSLFDFGGLSITYLVPLEGALESLVELSESLTGNGDLLLEARERAREILVILGDAVERPGLADACEDYVVFDLAPVAELPEEWLTRERGTLARILRGESATLSPSEVEDTMLRRLQYSPDQLVTIDWSAALLVGEDMEDERFVLEFANVELVQLRLLDERLDGAVEGTLGELSRRRRWSGGFGLRSDALRRVAGMQIECAMLYEVVHNSLKLTGDQYLARVYRMAAERFHLASWEAGIERKLSVLDGVHEKLSTLATTRRLETLEWIIIVLIAVSILVVFLPL